jgi:16S rRNA (cytosine1402-N4)-methyltransferase
MATLVARLENNTSTPHESVLLAESIDALQVRPEGRYIDLTFGAGGHSRAILSRLSANGCLLAIDRDSSAHAFAQAMNDPRLIFRNCAFAQLAEVLAQLQWDAVDGILLDLGVSSMQLDEADRGFSFMHTGLLDMRMDKRQELHAQFWINHASLQEINEVLKVLGEEKMHRAIARQIVAQRERSPINTTAELASLIATIIPPYRSIGKHPATRTFQAIRMHINGELSQLAAVLPQCETALTLGGRLAIISFQSLEDRAIKNYLLRVERDEEQQQSLLPRGLPLPQKPPMPRLRAIGKAILPSDAECVRNRRSRSAKLRVAQKVMA